MSKIKVLPGQRWLKSKGPHRDQNIILHILEVTPRRFYAIAHVVGVNAAVDNGPVFGTFRQAIGTASAGNVGSVKVAPGVKI